MRIIDWQRVALNSGLVDCSKIDINIQKKSKILTGRNKISRQMFCNNEHRAHLVGNMNYDRLSLDSRYHIEDEGICVIVTREISHIHKGITNTRIYNYPNFPKYITIPFSIILTKTMAGNLLLGMNTKNSTN